MRWIPAILWTVLIFSVSSIPDLSPNDLGVTLSDKIAHFAEFGMLALLVVAAMWPRKILENWAWILLLSGLAVAALDELWQIHVPGRESELLDWVADAAGYSVIWLAGRAIARMRLTS